MFTTKETEELTGISKATLRYYEKEKLLPYINRTVHGYRRYSDADIEWIQMIKCLRDADVSISEIRIYVTLLVQGGITLEERLVLVKKYMETLQDKMQKLKKAILLTESKKDFYEKLLKDKRYQKLTYQEEWQKYKESE